MIKGISEVNKINVRQKNALVLYNFGKYLTKKKNQPIIDQHVIRAFVISKTNDKKKISFWRKNYKLDKYEDEINKYKNWLSSNNLNKELKLCKNFTYFIDSILYATGKTIKKSKKEDDF